MSLTEVEVPQEEDLRRRLKDSEARRTVILKAGFRACTAKDMLCHRAGELKKCENGEHVLECGTNGSAVLVTAIFANTCCLREQLEPIVCNL
ncbi:MAG TPA: hypothetical protein VFP46_02445 [Candidatus Paceibacterota bacterium]|nr:hypothetical protein [Candidatus Paceibacterota bacterium]